MAGPQPPGSREVRRQIDAGKIPTVWLWSGPEDYLKQEALQRLSAKLVDPGLVSLNVSRFRCGVAVNAGERKLDPLQVAVGTARTTPMLGDRQVVFLEEIDRIGKKDAPVLLDYVASPSPQTVLVLSGEKGPGTALHRELKSRGAVQAVFWTPFENDTRRWVILKFQDRGLSCSPDAAQALIEACGGGAGRQVPIGDIAPEVEKVALSLGDRKVVTPDDTRVVARKAHEEVIWEITNRMTVRDLSGALRALDGALLFKENAPVRIVFSLAGTFRQIALARDLMDAGMKGSELRSAVGAYRWEQVERGASGRTGAEVRRGMVALAQAERILKSQGNDPRVVLELTLGRIC